MRNAIINRANPPWKLNARMFKFMLVGFSGTVLDYSLLFLLKALGRSHLAGQYMLGFRGHAQ